MIKRGHNKHYERKIQSNKAEYSTSDGMYCNTHDVKLTFCMRALSSSKIINHHFQVDNYKGESGIGYDMIIGCDLMVQLGIMADFKRQCFQWYGATLLMKDHRNFLGKSVLTKRKMREVVMQTAEPAST